MIPAFEDYLQRIGCQLRQYALEQTGSDEPRTYVEWEELLSEFVTLRNQDIPDGAEMPTLPSRGAEQRMEAALRAVVEAGRMSTERRARYCASIAQAALDATEEGWPDGDELVHLPIVGPMRRSEIIKVLEKERNL